MAETKLKSAYDIYKHRHKTLLHNWEEERRVIELQEHKKLPDDPKVLQYGHPGILTLNEKAELSKTTDFQDSYRYPMLRYNRKLGSRREYLERELSEKIQSRLIEELTRLPEKPDYKTATMEAYNIEGFESKHPPPKQTHDYRTEQPLTYWAENYKKIHGVSMVKAGDTVFRKNDAFSKPISEYWGEAEPYEQEPYPYM